MADKHTPGPWRVYGKGDHLRIEARRQSSGHMVIVEGVGGYRLGDGYSDLSQLEANARLIAAAPELLEALEDLLTVYSKPDDRICCNGVDCGCMGATEHQRAEHYARELIAKARGEQ